MSREPHHYHEDGALFREALSFTQLETGFSSRLIEKDYYCSLLLQDLLATTTPSWVFKGGTCLSKVHGDFNRMSEDLDFAFSVSLEATRSQRSQTIVGMKQHLATLTRRLAQLSVAEPLRGCNNSTQYVARLIYRSVVTAQDETIKVEFALREPIREPVEHLHARTLLIDPLRHAPALAPLTIPALSCREAYCEKLRAALTRRVPAIRDFYDIDHGVQSGRLDTGDQQVIDLVRKKLAVQANDAIDMSEAKYELLRSQVQGQLRPVLREADYTAFDLKRAFALVLHFARSLR